MVVFYYNYLTLIYTKLYQKRFFSVLAGGIFDEKKLFSRDIFMRTI